MYLHALRKRIKRGLIEKGTYFIIDHESMRNAAHACARLAPLSEKEVAMNEVEN